MESPRPPDPLESFGARRLRRLAKRADQLGHRSEARFTRLAGRVGVTPRRLRLLGDAWASGGNSGLAALGPAPASPDDDALNVAANVLEMWRRRHFPEERLRWDVWRNRVTVWRLSSAPSRSGPQERPLMQLRLTADGRWHLYRKAAQGEWWPVIIKGRGQPQNIDACLDTVRLDTINAFWGVKSTPSQDRLGQHRHGPID